MADETLVLLVNEIRNKTLKLLAGLSDEQARFAAPGLNNTILWHAGHAYVLAEHLGIAAITKKPGTYPDGWFEKFSWKSNPATVTDWPPLAQVMEKLSEQLARLSAAVQALSAEQLSAVIGDPAKGRTLRYSILHGLHDEANHQGEIWLLRKLQAKT